LRSFLLKVLGGLTLTTVSLLASPAQAQRVDKPMISLGGSLLNLSASGSDYQSKDKNLWGYAGDVSVAYNRQVRIRFAGMTDPTFEYGHLSAGVNYHLNGLSFESQTIDEAVMITRVPNISVYGGVDISLSRIAVTLDKRDGTGSSAVNGALFGPTLRAGGLMILSPRLFATGEAFATYGISSTISSAAIGLTFGLSYVIDN
jgi:hypothetical protein